MTLDPAIAALLESRTDAPDQATLSLADLRARARDAIARWRAAGVIAPAGVAVEEGEARIGSASVPVRIYRPEAAGSPLPIVVFAHGGGWVLCDLDTHDGICRAICCHAKVVVVSVDYRRPPEHPLPTPVEDCELALTWAAQQAAGLGGDPRQIFVAGDSAGGNLAAVLALRPREASGIRLAGQVLIYPAVDTPHGQWPSMLEFKAGQYGQNYDLYERFALMYVKDAALLTDPRFAPLRSPSLAAAPPAIIITAQFDMLRDEGEAYAAALAAAGVPVTLKRFAGVNHGYAHLTGVAPAADETFALIATWISAAGAACMGQERITAR